VIPDPFQGQNLVMHSLMEKGQFYYLKLIVRRLGKGRLGQIRLVQVRLGLIRCHLVFRWQVMFQVEEASW
jgi:hypothetical protein